jgi:hypothetical protein
MKRGWWESIKYQRESLLKLSKYHYRNTGRWHWFKYIPPVWLVRETVNYFYTRKLGRLIRNLLGDFCPNLQYKVCNFTYNGFSGQKLEGYAPYTSVFKEWTEDPGIQLHKCSDGKERRIPGWALEPINLPPILKVWRYIGIYVPVIFSEQELKSNTVNYFGPASKS